MITASDSEFKELQKSFTKKKKKHTKPQPEDIKKTLTYRRWSKNSKTVSFNKQITITVIENWKHYNHEDFDPSVISRVNDKYNINYGDYD